MKLLDRFRRPKLPEKTSELIRVAVRDLEAVESQPEKYQVDMWEWHDPEKKDKCLVCLAGSVIAKTLRTKEGDYKTPYDFDAPIRSKLFLLNQIREHVEYNNSLVYADDPSKFKDRLLEIADEYEAKGD